MGTYSLWQADDQRYSLGGRVRRTEPNRSPEPPLDWTATDMERLEALMEKAARELAARATPDQYEPGDDIRPSAASAQPGSVSFLRESRSSPPAAL
jgi:hypothetical protein